MTSELSSSQEFNYLPLSQETFLALYSSVPENIRECLEENNLDTAMFDVIAKENAEITSEQLGAAIASVEIPKLVPSSALPVISDFAGVCEFNVLPPQCSDGINKTSPFVYSNALKRLYVKKDEACPFYFSTSQEIKGFFVRAVLYFTAPEHMKKPVIRCFNDDYRDKEKGDIYSQHLLRCESQQAKYFEDVHKRCNVVVPFENPEVGQTYVTYIYKFKCYTSCIGGPNRRPISIVFSLEKDNLVYGRRKIDLKVCSCPFRDKNTDESRLGQNNSLLRTPSSGENSKKMSTKRKMENSDEEKLYMIRTRNKECYDLLRTVKKYFYFNKFVKQNHNFPNNYDWSPNAQDMVNLMKVLTSSCSSGEEKL